METFGVSESGEWPDSRDIDAFPPADVVPEDDVRVGDVRVDDEGLPGEPDAVALVVEVADLEAGFAAQRIVRVDALRCEALTDVTRYGGGSRELVMRSLRLELASALRIIENAAGMLLARAESLVHRYPTVLESLSHARVTERHAQILVDAVDVLDRDVAARLVEPARELAESLPVGSFRRALQRLIDRETAPTLTERHEAAVRRRRVVVEPDAEGMSWLHALIPSVEAHAIHGRITAMAGVIRDHDRGAHRGGATPEGSGERSLDEIRADVFCDLLIDGTVAHHPTAARGIRATVVVTAPALALLGADGVADPAEVEGVGPIPIQKARELCGSAAGWMRVLTHPETGAVVSVGHHTLRHHGGWVIRQTGDGSLEWISPHGRRYIVAPERRMPAFFPGAAA